MAITILLLMHKARSSFLQNISMVDIHTKVYGCQQLQLGLGIKYSCVLWYGNNIMVFSYSR